MSAEDPTWAVLEPGIVELVFPIRMGKGSQRYLSPLGHFIESQPHPVALFYDATKMEEYDTSIAMDHVGPFRSWGSRLLRIAVASPLTSIKFAIATVALASKKTIRSFPDRDSALEWLRSEAARDRGVSD